MIGSRIEVVDGERAVSPVIAVILLVAVTVSIAGLATYVAFNAVDQTVSENPDAEVSLIFEQNISGSRIGYLHAEVVSNQNVGTIVVETPSGNTAEISNVGDTTQMEVTQQGLAFARAKELDQVIAQINIDV